MNIDEFWKIVERVHAAAPRDMPAKCKLLAGELRRLAPREIVSFCQHFCDCYWRANSWDIRGGSVRDWERVW